MRKGRCCSRCAARPARCASSSRRRCFGAGAAGLLGTAGAARVEAAKHMQYPVGSPQWKLEQKKIERAKKRELRASRANRLDADGHLQIVSSEHRQQSMNLEAAMAENP